MPRCLLALLVLTLAACASRPPTGGAIPQPLLDQASEGDRASDGLLADSTLQAVVHHQLARDGASLIASLNDSSAAVRARAALALGSVQDPAAIPALLDALRDADPLVRTDAAFALGQTADSTAEARLLDALVTETWPEARRELMDALGKTGSTFSLRQLVTLQMVDSAPTQQADHALALARYGLRGVTSPSASALLGRYLESDDPAVRHNAAYFFGRIRSTEPWLFLADDLVLHTRRLAETSAPEPALMHLALALGRIGDDDSLALLRKLLADRPDWRVRTNAARALASNVARADSAAGSTANLDALFARLDDNSPHVRLVAAQGLAAQPGSPLLAARALGWIRANDTDWRTAAALLPILVGSQQNEMIDYSQSWLRAQTSPFALAAGIAALRAADDDASLGLLFEKAQDDDTRVAYAALDALKTRWKRDQKAKPTLAPRYYAAFEQALERRDLATAYAAAPALADSTFAPFGAAPLLQRVYTQMAAPDDIEPMVEIVRALGTFKRDSTVIGFLLDAAVDGHPVVRRAAADALETRVQALEEVNLIGEALPPTPGIDWDVLARLGRHPTLTFEVVSETGASRGEIVMRLDASQAPQTTQTLARLCAAGTYDGVPFHRVVPNFVIQGGDSSRRDGFGGPGFTIRSEFTRTRYTTGTVGIASAGKDTEGNQYFVTHSPQPHLDGRYTAVGHVAEGQDVADAVVQGDVVSTCEVRSAK
ncbi:MAG: HEAT repeat domain-containing protein [Bacteroidota bacterium]